MDIASRSKWYLKNLLHCKDNGWILITHEYMRKHWEQLQEEVTPSLFQSWEMHPFTIDEVKDVEQYFIPDELFDQLERRLGSRTEILWQLSNNGNEQLENCLQDLVDAIRSKHPHEKIDGMFHSLEAWQPLRNVCKLNNICLIPYSFSALRKPHGYRQTLYFVSQKGRLCTTEECQNRFTNYLDENNNFSPIFSNRELIAIFGKERTLPLLPLLQAEPKYEMGICTECFSFLPQFSVFDKNTDDDTRYECEKLYDKSQITVRNHSLQVDYMHLDRTTVHNDPAAWILSSRRLTLSRSQIGLKILLWNRTAIVPSDSLSFSFMCEKDYTSTRKVDLRALNFYLFCYLIPNDLMFSGEYWQWRMTNPTETEIYKRHLDFYIEKLNLPKSIFTEHDEPTRFKSLLQSRGCDEELINILLEDKHDFDIDYNTASSRLVVNGKSYWRLNKIENGVRHFHLELNESADTIDFYPLDDVAGCARLVSVSVNNKPVDVSNLTDFRYMPKVSGHYSLPIPPTADKTIIDIAWDYQSNNDFLQAHS
jgi:hypothetical protein